MDQDLIFGILMITVLLGFLFIVLVKVYTFLFRHASIFGSTLKVRLISLGITSIFFSQGVTAIFLGPVMMLVEITSTAYSNIGMKRAMEASGLEDFVNSLSSSLFRFLPFGTIEAVLVALGFWCILGQVIDSYNAEASKERQRMPARLRQNLILGLVFGVSIYLSLAAIIAVPYFLEDDEIVVTNNTIRSNLDSINNIDIGTHFMVSREVPNIVRAEFRDEVQQIKNVQLKRDAVDLLNRMKGSYDVNFASRLNWVRLLNDEKEAYQRTVKKLYNDALSKYNAEEANLKSKLKLTYINQLSRWYEAGSHRALMRGESIKDIIRLSDEKFFLAQTNFNTDFASVLAYIRSDSSRADRAEGLGSLLAGKSYVFGMDNYYQGSEHWIGYGGYGEDATPNAPVPGEELGIFKGISQWLLKPRYMALVLIVGMLGFGLFGSAVSTFVKTKVDNSGEVDITGVIVRGVSAAIVIFLAVKGGISVFIQGETDINPYSLFLTCLIGAVYSERIWEWAKEQLDVRFSKSVSREEGAAVERANLANDPRTAEGDLM